MPTINNNIQEIHLINCKELSSIDFSKYTSVKKICMYGNTLEKSTEAQWKTMIEQLYTLSTNITKQEQQKIAFFAIPKTITVSASLKHIQLPRTYTGEIPKNSNSSQSQIQYLSALGATSVAQDAFKDQQALTELYLPNVREVKSNAFYHCFKIEKVSLDKCEVLEEGAFRTNRALQSMYLPLVKKLGKLSIAYTRSNKLKIGDLNNQEFKSQSEAGLYLPFCEEIGDGACRGDNEDKVQIVNVNCPVCKTLGVEAFRQLTALKIVNIPEVETIGQSAFEDCSLLTKVGDINDISNNSIYLPKVKSIANYAFKNGDKGQNIIIQSIILPECERIGREAFMRYRTMKTLSIPKCKSIGILSFYDPYKLQELEATELETIGANAFQYASVPIRSFKTVNGNKKIDNGYLELPNCKKIETKAFWGSGAHSIRGTNVVKLPKCESAADDSFRAAYLTTLDASKLSNRAKILSTSKSG
ncbi:MAG: leucine-rich repeat protein [Alphaproteobacteria bacterium]|nr:leucine-rich repeat protein [Alphaproteobacteria bacterium]